MPKAIEFMLEGEFQAWGAPSAWDYRAVGEPTPRSIAGMIGACMGLSSLDPKTKEKLLELQSLDMDIKTIRRGNVLIDFQTIHTLWPDEHLPTANGDIRRGKADGVVVKKEYTVGAAYKVRIEGAEEMIDEIYKAMCFPVWPPYLGRKNCVPYEPIIPKYVD